MEFRPVKLSFLGTQTHIATAALLGMPVTVRVASTHRY